MTSATSMLARMKLVLVQSLGVSRIVIRVKPLPAMLTTPRMASIVTLPTTGFPDDIWLATLLVVVVVLMQLLTLKYDESDVTSVIVPFLCVTDTIDPISIFAIVLVVILQGVCTGCYADCYADTCIACYAEALS